MQRIALLMGQDLGYCRGMLRGIHTYAVHKARWVFRDGPPDMRIFPSLREWRPHGIIAHLFDAEFARRVIALHKPLVNTTSTLVRLKAPLVEVDHLRVGRLAAEHFLERGLRTLRLLRQPLDGILEAAGAGLPHGVGQGRFYAVVVLRRISSPAADRFELEERRRPSARVAAGAAQASGRSGLERRTGAASGRNVPPAGPPRARTRGLAGSRQR